MKCIFETFDNKPEFKLDLNETLIPAIGECIQHQNTVFRVKDKKFITKFTIRDDIYTIQIEEIHLSVIPQ